MNKTKNKIFSISQSWRSIGEIAINTQKKIIQMSNERLILVVMREGLKKL